jgi:hypothetical protein
MSFQISPSQIFEQAISKGGVCPLIYGCNPAVGVAANTLMASAVAGKRILVVGGFAYSNGAFTQLTFKSASGGTNLRSYAVPANTVATPNVQLCPNGLFDGFETNTGEGLYVDNSAVIALISLVYLTYTP